MIQCIIDQTPTAMAGPYSWNIINSENSFNVHQIFMGLFVYAMIPLYIQQ
jgi:hypothetical protein